MSLYLPSSLQQPFKGILFDLDGTIIDSEDFHYAAFKQALSEYGYDLDSLGVTTKFAGSFRNMFAAIAEQFKMGDNKFEDIYQRKVDITLATPANNVELIDGVISFLELIKEKNIPMGIVTNSEQAYLEHVLTGLELQQYFQHLVHAEHVVNPKPAPDGYNYGSQLFDQPAQHLLAFENTDAGIMAAKTAGLKVIGIRGTDRLGTSNYDQADLTIDHFGDQALDDLTFTV
ncbi:MAG: HAD family phosphatase [Patescibacteria group bacterium]|jgi:HAD superfamily hydrolase (TIGR01509 family)